MYKASYVNGMWQYFKGDKAITREEYESKFPPKEWDPSQGSPFTCGDTDDFTNSYDPVSKTMSKRYFPQLARFPGDKAACFEHVNQAVEVAKRLGFTIERE